jgi:CheY-like chemotaxis protein
MQKSIHVLLIEDDHEDVELFEEILNNFTDDYRLQIIADGGAFSTYMEQNQEIPNVIVMDYNLPKVHGREILKQIKDSKLYIDIPVVVLTTSSAPEDKQYALQMGAVNYFVKPNTPRDLEDIVAYVLDVSLHTAE